MSQAIALPRKGSNSTAAGRTEFPCARWKAREIKQAGRLELAEGTFGGDFQEIDIGRPKQTLGDGHCARCRERLIRVQQVASLLAIKLRLLRQCGADLDLLEARNHGPVDKHPPLGANGRSVEIWKKLKHFPLASLIDLDLNRFSCRNAPESAVSRIAETIGSQNDRIKS